MRAIIFTKGQTTKSEIAPQKGKANIYERLIYIFLLRQDLRAVMIFGKDIS